MGHASLAIVVAALCVGGSAASAASPVDGRYDVESIEAFPAHVQGSATLFLRQEPGRTGIVAWLVGMKAFGDEIPEPPQTILLSGRVAKARSGNRVMERLELIGTFVAERGKACFVRLTGHPLGARFTGEWDLPMVGWLTCGKTAVQLGFSARRQKDFERTTTVARSPDF